MVYVVSFVRMHDAVGVCCKYVLPLLAKSIIIDGIPGGGWTTLGEDYNGYEVGEGLFECRETF